MKKINSSFSEFSLSADKQANYPYWVHVKWVHKIELIGSVQGSKHKCTNTFAFRSIYDHPEFHDQS